MHVKQLSAEVEQVSQIYAEKYNIERDATWFVLKLQEEIGELIQSYLMLSGKARTKGKSSALLSIRQARQGQLVFMNEQECIPQDVMIYMKRNYASV